MSMRWPSADPAPEGESPQGARPPLGVRPGEDDLVVLGTDQLRRPGTHGGQPLCHHHRGFVATDLGLEPQVVDLRRQGGLRGQSGAGVVEVRDRRATGGHGALGGDVDGEGR